MLNWPPLKKKEILLLISCLAIVGCLYLPVLNGFFQQDEWLAFGNRLYFQQTDLGELIHYSFQPSGGHYTPLNFLSVHFLFFLLGLNYSAYAVLSIFLHLLTTFLVFYFSYSLLNNSKKAIVVAFIFGTASAGFQAVAWSVADIGTHGSTIFALLSLTTFFYFLKNQQSRIFIFSLILLVVSLLFKEISLGIVIMMFASLYLFGEKFYREKKIYGTIIIIFGLLYLLFRMSYLFSNTEIKNSSLAQNSFVHFQTTKQITYNTFTFPLKGVVQTMIPTDLLVLVAKNLTPYLPNVSSYKPNTSEFDIYSQKFALELINAVLFLILISFLIFYFKKKSDNFLIKTVLFSCLFIIMNSFIYAFSPERSGIISLIDSRNLYFLSVGTAILLTVFFTSWKNFKVFGYFFIVLFCVLNIVFLTKGLKSLTLHGIIRKQILEKITLAFPHLPEKAIFYTQGDSSYYGLPEKELILPFQSGLGQTLLVWYQKEEQFPKEFFQNKFLWEITEQGYKEAGGRGFGYFRDFESLKNAVKQYNIPLNSVVAFSWYSKSQSLIDTTDRIRNQLKSEPVK